MKDIFKKLFEKENAFFNFYVLLLMTVVNVPITIKEAFSKELKVYRIENFYLTEIPYYIVSMILMFLFSILIIHANKILIILGELLYLFIEYMKSRLNL
jgi:hypothetical protein